MSSPVTPDLTDVFHAPDRAPCADRAFMLSAVNIPSVIEFGPTGYVVRVAYAQAAFAAHHLWQYEQELRLRPRATPHERVFPYAWLGSIVYIAMLVLVALAVVRGWWRADAFALGALDSGAVRAGQWWRVFTAQTLHVDIVHLMMNLGAGSAIGWIASRQLGAGNAWLLTVLGAALASLVEALLGAPSHRSVGASTAVFAALGLVAAHSWRIRGPVALTWARRVAPLVAGAALLGLLGTGASEEFADSGTNLVAHAFGFAVGAALGVLAALPRVAAVLLRIPQWLAGAAVIGLIGCSWLLALGT